MPLPFRSMHEVPSTYSITNTPPVNCFAITITVLSLGNILHKRSLSLSTNDCVLITSMKDNTGFLVTTQEGRSTDYCGELFCNLLLLTHVHRLNLTIISISPGWWNHLLREHHKVNGNNTWDFATKRTRLSWSGIHQRSPHVGECTCCGPCSHTRMQSSHYSTTWIHIYIQYIPDILYII